MVGLLRKLVYTLLDAHSTSLINDIEMGQLEIG